MICRGVMALTGGVTIANRISTLVRRKTDTKTSLFLTKYTIMLYYVYRLRILTSRQVFCMTNTLMLIYEYDGGNRGSKIISSYILRALG